MLFYQRTLRIREQILGQEHPETADTLQDFAIFQEAQENAREAASLYQQALLIRERLLGAQHPKTQTTRTAYDALLQRMAGDQQSNEHDPLSTSSETEPEGNNTGSDGEQRGDIFVMPPCPYCHNHVAVRKNGTNRSGSRRFHCRSCSRSFTLSTYRQSHDPSLKDQAVALKARGGSDRAIARSLGVDHHTVRRWIQATEARQQGGHHGKDRKEG